jgi:acyl carrier protein
MEREAIEGAVITTINDYLETQGVEKRIDRDTILLGDESELDSMFIVNVVIDIESYFQDKGYAISLASERAMSRRSSPFQTVATLTDFISELIEEAPA